MTFASFAKLLHFGISRPSLADKKYFWFSKLHPDKLDERDGMFTTIRLRSKSNYKVGQIISISLNDQNWFLFEAQVKEVKPVELDDLSEDFIKKDSDMTREEFKKMMSKLFPVKHGIVPEFNKISLERV